MKPPIISDFEDFCVKHDIPSALLVLPQPDREFLMLAHEITGTSLKQLGQLLVKHGQDSRPLN